jgi:hypothetical protein
MKNITFLLVTLAAAIAIPAQAQTQNVDWTELAPGVALGVDLSSIKPIESEFVLYDSWWVADKIVNQSTHVGACDGTNRVVVVWERQWRDRRLEYSKERGDNVRTVRIGSYDEGMLRTACDRR